MYGLLHGLTDLDYISANRPKTGIDSEGANRQIIRRGVGKIEGAEVRVGRVTKFS